MVIVTLGRHSPVNEAVTLDLKPHPTAYTESIFGKVRSKEIGKYEEMVWVNDLNLLHCSWVYDLKFTVSRKIIFGKGYIDRISGSLPESPGFVALKKQLTRDLMVGTEASTQLGTDCSA